MKSYDEIRLTYKPKQIKVLLIAESPPPATEVQSSRHFYRSERVRRDDRLFVNMMKAIYPETLDFSESELETEKDTWLRKFQHDGWYMIEALEDSQEHEVTKKERQTRIQKALPRLLERVRALAGASTKIILIKSNVFEVATEPLRQAGFSVLNNELLDYPGRYNQAAFREKLSRLAKKIEKQKAPRGHSGGFDRI